MSQRTRICLVGAGRAAQVHADSISNHIVAGQIVAIVDAVPETLQDAGARFGVQGLFDSLEQALQSIEFDAVVITTPTSTHRELVIMAADSRKHIFCEKPMALTISESDEMIAAVHRAGVILQIGFMRRFDPEFIAAWARVEAGEIGKPMLIKSLTHGPGLPPAWARDLKRSNGMLAEVNSHDWDTLRWFAASNPDRIYTEIANFKGSSRKVDVPNFYDTATVTVRFDSGALGAISGVCPCEYGYDARVEIVGENGIIQIGDLKGKAVTICNNRDRGIISPVFRTWPERFASAYVEEMRHFIHCVQNLSAPLVGGDDGRWAVAGALAATQSFLQERPVTLQEILGSER